jgi:hypothetical protein
MYREEQYQDLLLYFGTLGRAFVHLYMAITGGNDWSVYYFALEPTPYFNRLLFLVFITFGVAAVMNIVTGIFVQTAFDSNFNDKEIVVAEEMEAKRQYLCHMKELFDEMDEDETGFINLDEFERRLDDERLVAYFNRLKLDVTDARKLFSLLDYDSSNEVSVTEFLNGCYKLQGESRSLDVKIMQAEVHQLKELLTRLSETMMEIRGAVSPRAAPPHLQSMAKSGSRSGSRSDLPKAAWLGTSEEIVGSDRAGSNQKLQQPTSPGGAWSPVGC